MSGPTILLVEDNPITSRLVRFTLHGEGFDLREVTDGRSALAAFREGGVSLVLLDLCLPDSDGFAVLGQLRALPGGAEVPVLLFSGMLTTEDDARVAAAGFDDVVYKPVEPTRLVQIVRAHLPATGNDPRGDFGVGLCIVVADDDPVQRRLVATRMAKAGFEVVTAGDGEEALEHVRRLRPHAVVSDVLMPRLDGFGLCMEMRRDPLLAGVPIVLATNSYVEATDRELARRAGAQDLVLRTPELREVMSALHRSLSETPAPGVPTTPGSALTEEHMRRMMYQLERQLALHARAAQRCTVLSAEMSVIRGISDALARHEDIDEALRHTLAACFDAGGVSKGALFLVEGASWRVLDFGFGRSADAGAGAGAGELAELFGNAELLDEVLEGRRSRVVLPEDGGPGADLLSRAGSTTALLVPVCYRSEAFGVLFMLSRGDDLAQPDRITFAEAVAGQISQALAVAEAFRERERSERLAREQASLLRSILESIGDAVVVVDAEGRFTHWNPAADPIVGLVAEESHEEGFGVFHSDRGVAVPAEEMPYVRAMRGESVDGVEVFVRHGAAREGRWLSASARPWRDDKDETRGGVAVLRDVTDEKATRSQLIVADRMASVGMLAAGVAHEINNPLAWVSGNLDLARKSLRRLAEEGERSGALGAVIEMVSDAAGGAERVREIARDLKLLSRHEDASPGTVDIHEVLSSSVRMAWNEIRHRATLEKRFGPERYVQGLESRLGQVFLNLLVNAAQAIPAGNVAANRIDVSTRLAEPGWVEIEIADTGGGIPEEAMRHLFTPFFTTKAAGEGTGLGLAICHRIVTSLGGEILVDSEVGRGTSFRVRLRRAVGEGEVPAVPELAEDASHAHGRLLVIDDEPMIAALVARLFAGIHEVECVGSAQEGLAAIEGSGGFDAVICDLMMPQMTGMDLYQRLRESGSPLAERMVFMTGGAFTTAARAFLGAVPNGRVEKPFDPDELMRVVAEAMGRAT